MGRAPGRLTQRGYGLNSAQGELSGPAHTAERETAQNPKDLEFGSMYAQRGGARRPFLDVLQEADSASTTTLLPQPRKVTLGSTVLT